MERKMRTIPQIDKDITANRKQLRRLEKIDTMSAASWQDAWDRHPDLNARERDLYLERGLAQQARDEAQYKTAMRIQRSTKAKQQKKSAAKFRAQVAVEKAAPDMLAALKMFVAWDDNTHDTSPSEQHKMAMAAARQAIKRAVA
jgi:hypothetical protein